MEFFAFLRGLREISALSALSPLRVNPIRIGQRRTALESLRKGFNAEIAEISRSARREIKEDLLLSIVQGNLGDYGTIEMVRPIIKRTVLPLAPWDPVLLKLASWAHRAGDCRAKE